VSCDDAVVTEPLTAPSGSGRPAASRQRLQNEVLQYLDDHAVEIVDAVRELVRIPSISGSEPENAIQELLAGQLTGLDLEVDHWPLPMAELTAAADFPGMEVARTEAWGLVGRLPGRGAGPTLMLNGHIDVVPPGDLSAWQGDDPFSGAVDATTVSGRGSCDMKGGLVAAMWAVRALVAARVPLRGDLLLASVAGEEDGGLGTYAMLARGWRADSCVIPEPTSLDLVPANAGALTFRLRVHGLASHASRRTDGVSALERFWPVFSALRELESQRCRETDPLMARWQPPYPIEIGRVSAGDWSSSVPDLLVAEGRFGVALHESTQEAKSAFEAAVAAAGAADPWLRDHPVEVEWWGGQFAPGQTTEDAAIVSALARAHGAVSDRPQQRWAAPYGSDLRLMTTIGGVPTVQYGPGDAGLAHGPREHVPIDEVLTTARVLALVAMDQCGVG
jgi:acetylornithine deacetylase